MVTAKQENEIAVGWQTGNVFFFLSALGSDFPWLFSYWRVYRVMYVVAPNLGNVAASTNENTYAVQQQHPPLLPTWSTRPVCLDVWIDFFPEFTEFIYHLSASHRDLLLADVRCLLTSTIKTRLTGRNVALFFDRVPHLVYVGNDGLTPEAVRVYAQRGAIVAEITHRRRALWKRLGAANVLDALVKRGALPGGHVLYTDWSTLATIPDGMFYANLKEGLYDDTLGS